MLNTKILLIFASIIGIGCCLRGVMFHGGSCKQTSLYDPSTQTSQTIQTDLVPYFHSAAVVYGSDVYIIGGANSSSGKNPVSRTQIFDPITGVVTNGPPMIRERALHTAQVYNQWIIVCGGLDTDGNVLGDCEMLDPYGQNSWVHQSSPMVVPVHSHAAATLSDGFTAGGSNLMFVFGGVNRFGNPVRASFSYFYGPAFDMWITLEPMPIPRAGFTAITFNNRAVVCGGWSNSSYAQVLDTCDFYDPVGDAWAPYDSLNVARLYAGSASFSTDGTTSSQFILGGYSSFLEDPQYTIENYVRTNVMLYGDLPVACAGAAAVAIGGDVTYEPCAAGAMKATRKQQKMQKSHIEV